MPTWDALLKEISDKSSQQKLITREIDSYLLKLVNKEKCNVLVYASGWLQKTNSSFASIAITNEDINGVMTCINGMDSRKPLLLILHTPGGDANAASAIVGYLRDKKFESIRVAVPTFAMSAGTMIALASDEVIMGRQSQLGPIDPQIQTRSGSISLLSIIEEFELAQKQIFQNPGLANAWAPIISAYGPGWYRNAKQIVQHSKSLVTSWLKTYMLKSYPDKVDAVVSFFMKENAEEDGRNHGDRIDKNMARELGLNIKTLEDDNELQDLILSVYHLFTILFETSPVTKCIFTLGGRGWYKQELQIPK